MTPEDLQTLREGWDFEAKLGHGVHGLGGLPRNLFSTISAMANSDGGRILLGAKEVSHNNFDFVGIADIDKVESDLWNQLDNPQKLCPRGLFRREHVQRIEIEGARMLLLEVPRASRSQRPVYIDGSIEKGSYRRLNDGDHRMSEQDVRRMLADADPERDARVVRHACADDFDAAAVNHYRDIFVARKPSHAFSRSTGVEFLRQIGAWSTDREARIEGPTYAGILMFGREQALRDLHPHWNLDYREHSPHVARWADRVWPDGSWEPNIFNFYLRVVGKLLAGVKVPFALVGQFRNDETPVHDALREAFVNALVHADFAGLGGIRVIRRPAGYELVNPGLPLVTTEQLWRGGTSVPRNPTLLRFFVLVSLGERAGSGGPTILHAWREQQWRLPIVRRDLDLVETSLELRQDSLLPDESVAALTAEWGGTFVGLDAIGRLAMATAHAEGVVSHARLRELTDLHPRDLTLALYQLVQRELLEPMGKGTGRSYRLRSAPLDLQVGLFDGPSRSETLDAGSELTRAESEEVAQRSEEVAQRSEEVLDDVSAVASSEWAPRAMVRGAILTVCAGEFRTVAEVASQLHRTTRAVRVPIASLVRDGLLELLHPETLNHPKQAYRTKREDPPA
jgi:ATP-dependent DNA helicase RecG